MSSEKSLISYKHKDSHAVNADKPIINYLGYQTAGGIIVSIACKLSAPTGICLSIMPNELNNILTLDSDSNIETQQSEEDLIWHEITNAYRTHRILTGSLGGIERLEGGATIVIIYYKNFRVVIPITEMMVYLVQGNAHNYGEISLRQNKIINTMLGCEIDFIVKGLDSKTRSIAGSRKGAMLKKRQIFYFDQDASGSPKIYEDRVVQTRVIAVIEKVIRVEIFGVETSIPARNLSFDWLGDAIFFIKLEISRGFPLDTFFQRFFPEVLLPHRRLPCLDIHVNIINNILPASSMKCFIIVSNIIDHTIPIKQINDIFSIHSFLVFIFFYAIYDKIRFFIHTQTSSG